MKKVLYVIIGLVVVYLILCIVGPKASVIERTTVVNQKPDVVKAQLMDFKFFNEKWSPWTPKDPNIKLTYSGEVGKPGYKYDWEGNDSVGVGAMEFEGVFGDSVKQKLIFKGEWEMTSNVYLVATPEGEGTKVNWKLVMPMDFIWRGMGLFMNPEKMMGRDFNNGIANLKTAMESLTAAPNYDVKEVDFPETNLIGTKKQRMGMDKVEEFFGDNFGKIAEDMGKNKIEPMSMPSALYYDFKNEDMSADVVACFTAPKGAKVKGWENYEFPAGKAVMLEYHGGYNDMMAAHDAIKNYMKEKNLTSSVTLEEYVTDPGTEKDSTKWLTNIYYILMPSGK